MNENKKNIELVKGFIIYSIGSFGSKILTFLLVPLYTYYISTTDMGIYDVLHTTIGLLTPIITLQISDAAYTWMIRDVSNSAKYIRSTLQLLIVNSTIATVIILFVSKIVYIPYCIYFVGALVTTRMLTTIQRLLRGLKKQRLYALSGMVYTVIYLFFNIIQICFLGRGIESIFTSIIIANILTLVLIVYAEKAFRQNLFITPDFELIKKMLKFSMPLVPNQLNWWVINSSDKYVVTYFLGLSANGICSIAYKFPSILQMIFTLFNASWQDVSISDDDNNGKNMYNTIIFERLYKLYFSLIWIVTPATKIFVNIAMSEAYKIASQYIPILYLSTIFQAFSSFYGVGYLRSKNTKKAATTSIYGAVINLVVNIALIRHIGLYAASISSLVGFFVMWVMRAKQNSDELNIKINYKLFIPLLFSSIAVSTITSFSSFSVDVVLFFTGAIAFLAYNKEYIMFIMKKIKGR